MLNILIKTDSHYKVNRKRIRKIIEDYLRKKRIRGKTELSISVVGNRQMRMLNKKYRDLDETCSVLAFPQIDVGRVSEFIHPPDDILRLGDIILSYPQIIDLASEEKKLIDDKIDELIFHGLNNLLGES